MTLRRRRIEVNVNEINIGPTANSHGVVDFSRASSPSSWTKVNEQRERVCVSNTHTRALVRSFLLSYSIWFFMYTNGLRNWMADGLIAPIIDWSTQPSPVPLVSESRHQRHFHAVGIPTSTDLNASSSRRPIQIERDAHVNFTWFIKRSGPLIKFHSATHHHQKGIFFIQFLITGWRFTYWISR